MEALGAVIGCVGNCLSPHASNCWEHHKNIKKNSKELDAASKKLDARKKDVEEILKRNVKPGVAKETNEVLNWLKSVEGISKEIDEIQEEVREIKFYARAGCGKKVVDMTRKVEKLFEEGEFSGRDLVQELPQRGKELPTTTILEDETTSHKMRKKILACLLDEKVSKIGVFGMGGIGKTTALEHINNELLLNPKFDKVIFLTVSKAQDVKSLQDKIAISLQLELRKDADEKPRAAELYKNLKESRRFVLILDDMWKAFALKDVGIPEPTSENGCKLVLTTRELDVCRGMSCEETIEMELLSEEEALNLFNNSVGDKVSSNPELKETIKQVARECARLPLAIFTVAGSLKDNDNRYDWDIALVDMKGAASSSQSSKLMESLRLSYDRLKNKKHQECLLYCALYPEDYPIERDLLIDQLIAVGIVDETMMLPTERGQFMLNQLVSVSLLVGRKDSKCVKLHDSIRDMALQIMRESPTRFLAKAGEGVESIPAEVIWSEGVEMVSLMRSKIVEISIEQPNCPMLSSLFLNDNYYLASIPRNFFQQMQGLNVLDLSNTKIVELPESVSFLLNLAVLLLRYCRNLKHVPDLSKLRKMRRLDLCGTSIVEVPKGMEKLVKLTYLDLSNTSIKEVPKGMEKLVKLTYLNLSSTSIEEVPKGMEKLVKLTYLDLGNTSIKEVPKGMEKLVKLTYLNLCLTSIEEVPRGMEKLVKLTYLDVSDTSIEEVPKGILCNLTNLQYLSLSPTLGITEDLANHRNLKTLRCQFAEFKHFIASVRSLEEGSLTNFILTTKVEDDWLYRDTDLNAVVLNDCDTTVSSESADFPLSLPKNVEFLSMRKCRINVRSLCKLTSVDNLTNLKELFIRDCGDDLMYLFYYSQAIFPILQTIERLVLSELPGLREFVGIEGEGVQPSLPAGSFSSLKDLYINNCGNIKKLFTLKNASFPNLERIEIEDCEELEEIVSTSREDEIEEGGAAHHTTTVDVVTLPKLKKLKIYSCGNIKKLFSLKNPSFPNLEEIDISRCSELEEIVSTSRENEIEEGGAAHHTTTVDVVTLPKLMKLDLWNLPKLQSIPFVADSLESLVIRNCPNLRRIPFLDREPWHPSLKKVDIDKESWNSLEWNYLKDKDAYWRKFNR